MGPAQPASSASPSCASLASVDRWIAGRQAAQAPQNRPKTANAAVRPFVRALLELEIPVDEVVLL